MQKLESIISNNVTEFENYENKIISFKSQIIKKNKLILWKDSIISNLKEEMASLDYNLSVHKN